MNLDARRARPPDLDHRRQRPHPIRSDEAASRIRQEVDEDANIILGATFDESLNGIVRVSVVATGIDRAADAREANLAEARIAEVAQKLRAQAAARTAEIETRTQPVAIQTQPEPPVSRLHLLPFMPYAPAPVQTLTQPQQAPCRPASNSSCSRPRKSSTK